MKWATLKFKKMKHLRSRDEKSTVDHYCQSILIQLTLQKEEGGGDVCGEILDDDWEEGACCPWARTVAPDGEFKQSSCWDVKSNAILLLVIFPERKHPNAGDIWIAEFANTSAVHKCS